MALVFEEEKKFNWKGLLIVIVVILAIGGFAYFLFFTPVPAIEVIVSPAVRSTEELSSVHFDPASVVNSEDFRALRRYAGQPSIGQIGRPNPFIKF